MKESPLPRREAQVVQIQSMIIAGRQIRLDQRGFLLNPKDWDEEVAKEMARESGLEVLSEEHWRVIRFFREFFSYNGRVPLNHQVREGTGLSLLELEGLFPGGFKDGARRIAGLPNSKTCGGGGV